jgi:hypothetical protein
MSASRTFTLRLVLGGACLVLGCTGQDPARVSVESDRHRNLLTTALDAWQAGTPGALLERQPPIRFVDDDLIAGRQLLAYDLDDPDDVVRPFESVYVTLTLQETNGKTIERQAGYQVTTEPTPAVLRSEP